MVSVSAAAQLSLVRSSRSSPRMVSSPFNRPLPERLYSAGINSRFVRSPPAPKTTSVQGGADAVAQSERPASLTGTSIFPPRLLFNCIWRADQTGLAAARRWRIAQIVWTHASDHLCYKTDPESSGRGPLKRADCHSLARRLGLGSAGVANSTRLTQGAASSALRFMLGNGSYR